ncbi:MAG: hypothetical protein QM765_31675 [Myxococcales bacterium]
MKEFVRRVVSGLLVLAGFSQAGCRGGGPFLACLSVEPRNEQPNGWKVPVNACLSPPIPPRPDAGPPPVGPCLTLRPHDPPDPQPVPPDASSDARALEPQQVLAALSDRLPDDVKARLGLPKKS